MKNGIDKLLARRAEVLSNLGWRNLALLAFVVLVVVFAAIEIREEWLEDESWQDMADDVVAIVVGISLLWLVITESWRNRQELETWRQQAHQLSPGVSAGDPETLDAARSYAQAVEAQFATWGLSAGEHDVAVALLKGMSFQEIAAIRETREKTVRQQASSIYRKSGLSGRHELAAWFFEDLLSQAD